MARIEMERYQPSAKDSRKLEYVEQRTAQEVFEELRYQLDSIGYLPDEYFLMNPDWENGKEIPQGADLFCTTDYGSSEGIYLDVYLKWYQDENPITKSFITGKTLGESESDLDRMFLISSAITKAFHGSGAAPCQDENTILHLNAEEQRVFIDALIDHRNHLVEHTIGVENLLRRMTGSITAYINEVGQRPLKISDCDRAILAIHDGDFEAFKALYPRVQKHVDQLLCEAASRPGAVGRRMVMHLLVDSPSISHEDYLHACRRAIDTCDTERALLLQWRSSSCVRDSHMLLSGEMILYAYQHKQYSLAAKLIENSTNQQIQAAPPRLLYETAMQQDYRTASALVKKGIDADEYAVQIIRALAARRADWITERLLNEGMHIDPQNYAALHACLDTNHLDAAKILLERGMDFDCYAVWAEQHTTAGQPPIFDQAKAYWEKLQSLSAPNETPEAAETPNDRNMGGMILG